MRTCVPSFFKRPRGTRSVRSQAPSPGLDGESLVFPELSGLTKGLRLHAQGKDNKLYVAEIVRIAADTGHAETPILVHYMGHGDEEDEWIGLDRIRSKHIRCVGSVKVQPEAVSGETDVEKLLCLDVGMRLQAIGDDEVLYVAEVVAISTEQHADAPVLVHYIGFGQDEDEWLPLLRLRSKVLKQFSNNVKQQKKKATGRCQ